MVVHRNRVVVLALALVALAWLATQALTGPEADLLYAAPLLALTLPLAFGRYPGEEKLSQLAGIAPQRRRTRAPCRVPTPRSHVRVMQRGGRLVASAMAKRPPPASATFSPV